MEILIEFIKKEIERVKIITIKTFVFDLILQHKYKIISTNNEVTIWWIEPHPCITSIKKLEFLYSS